MRPLPLRNSKPFLAYSTTKPNLVDAARELLDIFVPPFHAEGETGWTCLHWAARHGMVETVERLVAVNAAESYLAARAARDAPAKEAVRSLGLDDDAAKKAESDPEAEEAEPPAPGTANAVPDAVLLRNTPLHWAAFHGHLRVVWLLLQAGYATDDLDEVGNSPLHLAAAGGHAACARALLNDGSDASRKNDFSNAPAEVTTDEAVRALLRKHVALPPKSAGDRAEMHAGNLRKYRDVAAELGAMYETNF